MRYGTAFFSDLRSASFDKMVVDTRYVSPNGFFEMPFDYNMKGSRRFI